MKNLILPSSRFLLSNVSNDAFWNVTPKLKLPLPDVSARSANVGPKLRLAGRKSPSAGSPSNTKPPEEEPSGNDASEATSALLNCEVNEKIGSFGAGRKCAEWLGTPGTSGGASVTPLVSRCGS